MLPWSFFYNNFSPSDLCVGSVFLKMNLKFNDHLENFTPVELHAWYLAFGIIVIYIKFYRVNVNV
jgi:hypothetical protein